MRDIQTVHMLRMCRETGQLYSARAQYRYMHNVWRRRTLRTPPFSMAATLKPDDISVGSVLGRDLEGYGWDPIDAELALARQIGLELRKQNAEPDTREHKVFHMHVRELCEHGALSVSALKALLATSGHTG